MQGDGGKRAHQREGRADRQVDAAGGDDKRHRGRDDQKRRTLAQHVQQVAGGEKGIGGKTEGDGAAHEEHRDAGNTRVAAKPVL